MKKIKYLICFSLGLFLALTINIVGASMSSTEVLYNGKTVKEALDELYKKSETLEEKVKLGDYISMTPTSTSYTTDKSITGYTSTQTINPSELNLWRVIKINDDGTIEVVSEYASSVNLTFYGQTGYQNFIGYLNVVASQYTNTKYVEKTRIMGYNGQTEYITDTSKLTSTTAPWSSTTSDNSNESKGGGDMLYEIDTNLVQNALGTLKANTPDETTTGYWLGSRRFLYTSSSNWYFHIRYVGSDSNITVHHLIYYKSGFYEVSRSRAIRPILTLKSGLKANGSGTSSDPYVLP